MPTRDAIETLDLNIFIEQIRTAPELVAANGNKNVQLFLGEANEDTKGIYVVYDLINAPDTYSIGGEHNFANPEWVFRVCNVGSGLGSVARLVKALNKWLTSKERRGVIPGTDTYTGKFVRTRTSQGIDSSKDVRVYWFGLHYRNAAWATENG